MNYWKPKFVASLLAGTLVACTLVPTAYAASTLQTVKTRDKLVCAVNGSRTGFSAVNSKGEWGGIDVDTCRAVAAAVLGDSSKVQFTKSNTQTRFTLLQTGDVDMTAANATWTLSRQATLGLQFMPTTFYDGQGFMVNKKLGVKNVKDLNGASICLRPGSTSQQVVDDVARKYSLKLKPIVIADQMQVNTAFFNGRCDVMVQSTAGLAADRAAAAPDPENWIILPQVFGKDPEGPVVRAGDPQWASVVQWTVFALIEAEEKGITSKNVDKMLNSDDAVVQRLLGVNGDLGQKLGLSDRWAYNAIKQLGNYSEIFDRNVGADSQFKLDRGLNALWTDGGLLYAPPFK